jgi:hypothetical protein
VTYLLDANVFIEAKRLHYGFDFCPAFWEWIDIHSRSGTIKSVAKVGAEISNGGDDLAEWTASRMDQLFLDPTVETLEAFRKVSQWVMQADYEPAARNTFLEVADSFLVAQALANQCVVVTKEKPENSKRRVKIPNACVAMNVKFISVYEMLRLEKARFVLPGAT